MIGPEDRRRLPSRRVVTFLIGSAVAFLQCACSDSPKAETSFRNLVVIVADTLRSDHLGAYGYGRRTAPFVSRLAREGIQLQGASASSWTKTSIATLLTGLYPQRHQTNSASARLPRDAPYLSELLSRRGFTVIGYSANRVIGGRFGFTRGFTHWEEGLSFPKGPRDKEHIEPVQGEYKAPAKWATDVVVELARDVAEPFFVYVHYLDPHAPSTPSRSWDGRSRESFVQPVDFWQNSGDREAVLRLLVDQYDGAILEMDRETQRLVGELDSMGFLEDTLVVVTADHEEEFMEHGGLTHNATLFDESLRVPFILWSRTGLPSYQLPTGFHHVDFLPTVLEAPGVEVPKELDGLSQWREIVAQEVEEREQLHLLEFEGLANLAIVKGGYKLVHQRADDPWTPTNMLFQVTSDPAELHPVDEPEIRRSLLRELIDRHNKLAAKTLDLTRPSLQLLGGWYSASELGTWSGPRASLVVPVEPNDRMIEFRGELPPGAGAARCSIDINGERIGMFDIAEGPFELVVPLPAAAADLAYLDLSVTPFFETRTGQRLGLLWQSVSVSEGAETSVPTDDT
jgi:arylsulfatase A-like enzyme